MTLKYFQNGEISQNLVTLLLMRKNELVITSLTSTLLLITFTNGGWLVVCSERLLSNVTGDQENSRLGIAVQILFIGVRRTFSTTH